MYFRVNVKMKKPTCCRFTWIAFVKLNFTVACLLIKKKNSDGPVTASGTSPTKFLNRNFYMVLLEKSG